MSAPGGTIVVNDLLGASSVQLIGGTGGIALNSNILTNTLDLNATGGGVTEAPGASVSAGDLESTLGVTGNVSLLSPTNQIQTILAFPVTPSAPGQGNFQMADGSSLTVVRYRSRRRAATCILQSDDPARAFTIAPFRRGDVTAPAGTASFQVDGFLLEQSSFSNGLVTTGTFELAPNTLGQTVILGASSATGLGRSTRWWVSARRNCGSAR